MDFTAFTVDEFVSYVLWSLPKRYSGNWPTYNIQGRETFSSPGKFAADGASNSHIVWTYRKAHFVLCISIFIQISVNYSINTEDTVSYTETNVVVHVVIALWDVLQHPLDSCGGAILRTATYMETVCSCSDTKQGLRCMQRDHCKYEHRPSDMLKVFFSQTIFQTGKISVLPSVKAEKRFSTLWDLSVDWQLRNTVLENAL